MITKVLRTATIGSCALALSAATAGSVLTGEAMIARRIIGKRKGSSPYADGLYGQARTGVSLRFAMLGDSTAAGYGMADPAHTPGVQLAQALADQSGRAVRFRSLAVVGARSADLHDQVGRTLLFRPHVAVILIGANDVTHLVPVRSAARALGDAVGALTAAGIRVVVGTCPDLRAVRPLYPPLRNVVTRYGAALASAQRAAVIANGGTPVSLADTLGPAFFADPPTMFGPDRYHPSRIGYQFAAQALLPTVLTEVAAVPAAGGTAKATVTDLVRYRQSRQSMAFGDSAELRTA
ncbi:MAG: SGNH/GDSL hydrolase family protein [Actinomycetes bacterium]